MKPSRSPSRENDLLNTISYFAFFAFTPNFQEIYTFFPRKISKKELKASLERLTASKKLVSHADNAQAPVLGRPNGQKIGTNRTGNSYLYTLPQYSNKFKNRAIRGDITKTKLRGVSAYLKALSLLPVIRYVGVSGSAAMGNCKIDSDVDLCIVTAPNLLFTGRFLSILLATALGLRHRQGVCLNLFLDERDLAVPESERSPYTAHEVLQLKPILDKGQIHHRFLWTNRWVQDYFPNAGLPRHYHVTHVTSYGTAITRLAEFILKKIQLRIIHKNATGHLISPTQLWLFKRDFKMRLKSQ